MAYVLLLISLLIPITSWANCLSWVMCPWVPIPGDASGRRPSISSSTFPADTIWYQIDIADTDNSNPHGLGELLVCIESNATKEAVDAVAVAGSCQVLNRGEVTSRLVRPKEIYFDGVAQALKFKDGKAGRQNQDGTIGIPKNIDDDLVNRLK